MANYYRRDDWVQNGRGEAVPNCSVTYYSQPSLALASVFTTSTGTAGTNPQTTDGEGHTVAYLPTGMYTITYSGAQITTLTLADQAVQVDAANYSVAPIIPTGLVNGVNRTYTLPTTPANPTAAQYYVNRALQIYGTDYSITGTTLTNSTALPLQTGDLHEIFYT